MNYGAMQGERSTFAPNPVTGNVGSAPFNFLNYQSPGYGTGAMRTQGTGSNQYQSMPPWMNTNFQTQLPYTGSQLPGGGYLPPGQQPGGGGSNWGAQSPNWGGLPAFNPIGPEIAPMPPAVAQQLQNLMANHVAGQPYTFSQANPGMTGSWSPLQQEQLQIMQREFGGTQQQNPLMLPQNILSQFISQPYNVLGGQTQGSLIHPVVQQQLQNLFSQFTTGGTGGGQWL